MHHYDVAPPWSETRQNETINVKERYYHVCNLIEVEDELHSLMTCNTHQQ